MSAKRAKPVIHKKLGALYFWSHIFADFHCSISQNFWRGLISIYPDEQISQWESREHDLVDGEQLICNLATTFILLLESFQIMQHFLRWGIFAFLPLLCIEDL